MQPPAPAVRARQSRTAIVAAALATMAVAVGSPPPEEGQPAVIATAGTVDRTTPAASRSDARTELRHVHLHVDGVARETHTAARTVSDLLAQEGVSVDNDDVVSPPMGSPVSDGMVIEVVLVDVATEHVPLIEPHETVEEETDELERGTREVVTEGVDGVQSSTYRVTRAGGQETERELIAHAVLSQRVDEVVRVGTAEPEPDPEPASDTAAPDTPAPSYSPGTAKAIAADMVAARGWDGRQMSCLETLWERESNWNHLAENPSSGAYGIPQSLPADKMASAGSDWRTNPATQITWGLDYIAGRYGSPCSALDHSYARGWY